jgi:hypothetical protein
LIDHHPADVDSLSDGSLFAPGLWCRIPLCWEAHIVSILPLDFITFTVAIAHVLILVAFIYFLGVEH